MIWIKNILKLERMWISQSLLPLAETMPDWKVEKGPVSFPLNEAGNLGFGTLD